MSELDQIRESIDARIAELHTEIAALEAARAALRGGSGSGRTSARASTKPAAAAPRRRNATTAGTGPSGVGLPQITNGAGAEAAPAAAVTEALVQSAAQSRKPRTRTPTRTRTKRSKRSATAADVLLGGNLEAMLTEAVDGLSAVTISKRSNAGYAAVLDLLRRLESAGQVRRTGARRTSLWRLVTDEERIAARAAELAKLAASSAR